MTSPTKAVLGGSALGDAEIGVQAAQRLFREGTRAEIAERLTPEFAAAAITELARLQRDEAPGSYLEAIEGAEAATELFNVDPLQGVSEVIQNADDLGASTVRVALSGRPGTRDELLIVHDGQAVRLMEAWAMVLPYVSTKRADDRPKGRFGIGLKTLVKLGARLSVHSLPYEFKVEASQIDLVSPRAPIDGFWDGAEGETLFAIPLERGFDEQDFHDWFADWGSPSLLFLDSVRRVVLFELEDSSEVFDHRLEDAGDSSEVIRAGGRRFNARHVTLRDADDAQQWNRYSVELAVRGAPRRLHKKTGTTTPIGIAFVRSTETSRLFAGLPLRVSSQLPYDLNAQFDVDPSRGHVIESEWNAWLLRGATDFLAAAALARFRMNPRWGWFSVAVLPETAGGDDKWVVGQVSGLVEQVADRVRDHLRLQIGGRQRRLSELVYEDDALEGLLSTADLERLVSEGVAVPREFRDDVGRWRQVLDGLGVSRAVSVKDALELFDDSNNERSDEWFVRVASVALDAGLGSSLMDKLCIRFADGTIASPRAARETLLVVEEEGGEPFGVASGVTKVLAPAYLTTDGEKVRAWLRSERVLQSAATPERVLEAVAARDRGDPIDLDGETLLLLRNCLERIEPDARRSLGRRVGRVVRVNAYVWKTGRRAKTLERPSNCYLSAAIDKDPESWARVAARMAGLRWIDSSYASLIRTGGDRDRLGAQALFRLLGGETAPRLTQVGPDDSKYGVPARTIRWSSVPVAQREALRADAPRATHLRHDFESLDLAAVLGDLMAEKDRDAKKRRSGALVVVLNRAWPRLYDGKEQANAVHSDYGWQADAKVPATWLARASSEPWLANQNGALRPPRKLVLRTAANKQIYSNDRSVYAHGLGEELARTPAIQWLGIKSNPRASALVDELDALREANGDVDVGEAFDLYSLLADHVPSGDVSPRALVDDVDLATLQTRFGVVAGEPGLLFAGGCWRAPVDVLRGTPIFGNRRPFVPDSARLLPLWRALNVPAPSERVAVEVLREIAATPDESENSVLIDSYRFLASRIGGLSSSEKRTLKTLPLWTGTQWTRTRPLYACDDEQLADALSSAVPVWRPPCSLRTLGDLPAVLGVTVIEAVMFPTAGVSAADAVGSQPLRERTRTALQLLQEHLAQQDPELYRARAVPWGELVTAEAIVAPHLAIEVSVPGQDSLLVPRRAHVSRDPVAIFAVDEEALGTWDGAGLAIGDLFGDGDRDKVGLAWEAMWRRAGAGTEAKGVTLAEEVPMPTAGLASLEEQATKSRDRPRRKKRAGAPAPTATPTHGPSPPRRLKSITMLRVVDIERVNEDAGPGAIKTTKRRGLNGETTKPTVKPPQTPRRGLIAYTPEEREHLALDILRLVLGADDQEIVDYRHRRGIGSDAIDSSERFFEIKTASGLVSDDATLTANEAERAFRDAERFFLAVVSGLEEGEETEVRLIERPLETLDWKPQTSITLAGVTKKPSVRIRLMDEPENDRR